MCALHPLRNATTALFCATACCLIACASWCAGALSIKLLRQMAVAAVSLARSP